MPDNIHPVFNRMLNRSEREQRLGQRSKVLWFTGLSGAGKSTIAIALERALFEAGYFVQLLDGDNIRAGINNNLGFSMEDRQENIRRISEIARLYKESGVVVLCSFISPTIAIRKMARAIIDTDDFLEIFVNTPLEICEARDVKGLYAKARSGAIKNFTGISSPYEAPKHPFLNLETTDRSVADCIDELMKVVVPQLQHKK